MPQYSQQIVVFSINNNNFIMDNLGQDIFSNALSSNINALQKLQQIHNMGRLPRFIECYYQKKYKQSVEQSQQTSQNNKQINKTYNNDLKQKRSTFDLKNNKDLIFQHGMRKSVKFQAENKDEKPHQINKAAHQSDSQRYQKQNRSQLEIQTLSPNIKGSYSLGKSNPANIKLDALPKVQKPNPSVHMSKVQSDNLKPSKKHIQMEDMKPLKKQMKKIEKINFKQLIEASKEHRLQFQKINQQETQKQNELKEYYFSTKSIVQEIIDKYGINCRNIDKYLRKPDQISIMKEIVASQQKPEKSVKLTFKMRMSQQKNKSAQLDAEIVRLNRIFKNNEKKINKIATLIENSFYTQAINRASDTISEQQQEESSIDEPLENPDPKNRYSYLMAHTKQKSWSLRQRNQYETNRTTSFQQKTPVVNVVDSKNLGLQKVREQIKQQNKVIVNQKFKKLLIS